MDRKFSWKRTEDIEIDITDLIYRLCRQWQRIAVCGLIFAVILGGYGWQRASESADIPASDVAEEAELTEAEEQAVEDAVQLKNEISRQETYLDNSVLMQLDPFHKNKYIMLYCIDFAKRQDLPAITESYLNFVVNGGAADELLKSGRAQKLEKNCLAELISAYQKTYSSPYQVVVEESLDSSLRTESLFYVEITGIDAGTAEKMALDMQDVLEEYSKNLKGIAGNHRLRLVSSVKSVTSDSGLQSQQHDKRAIFSSNKTSLRAMTDAFSKEQTAVYKESAGVEGEDEEKGAKDAVSDEDVSGQNFKSILKFVILGLLGGIFAYCFIFACWYLFQDTVKNAEEMKNLYRFPFYGGISLTDNADRNKHGVMQETYGQAGICLLERVRIFCKKQEISRLCISSDFLLSEQEREYVNYIAEQLGRQGIHTVTAENTGKDTVLWDTLVETGNVLMVCRIGTTTHRMIDEAMRFYKDSGINVIGAMAFN